MLDIFESGLKSNNPKRIAFYQSMEETGLNRIRDFSPSTLQFLAHLEKCGHSIDYSMFPNELNKKLEYNKFDLIALSGCTPDMKSLFTRAKEIKERHPQIPIAVGGYMTSNIGDLLIHYPYFDIIAEGESENSFPLILKYLETKDRDLNLDNIALGNSPITPNSAKNILQSTFKRKIGNKLIDVPINNIYIKDNKGKIYFNSEKNVTGSSTDIAPLQDELEIDIPWWSIFAENSPGLSFDLFSPESSTRQWVGVSLYARRGCSGKCSFCSIKCGIRKPSIDNVIETSDKTISEYAHQTPKRKANMINFADDSFTQDRKYAKELLKKLRKTRLSSRLEMSMQHRVDDPYDQKNILDVEILDMLAENNFRQDLGVESLCPITVEKMGKSTNGKRYIKQAEELIIESLKRRIPTTTFAITASPFSTPETIAEDYLNWSKLAKKCYETTGRVFHLKANPELLPAHSSKITQEALNGTKDCQFVYQPYGENTLLQDNNIIGEWLPMLKNADGNYFGIFNPTRFIFEDRTTDFLEELYTIIGDKTTFFSHEKNPIRHYTNYIEAVGVALVRYAKKENNEKLLSIGTNIIENMYPVLEDKEEKRENLRKEAHRLFNATFYDDSLLFDHHGSFIDNNTDYNNIIRRLKGDPVEYNRTEEYIDKIVKANPDSYENLKKIIWGRESYFISVMLNTYSLIKNKSYDFFQDDTADRQDQGRKAINELLIIDSILNHDEKIISSNFNKFEGASLDISAFRDTVKWYPENAELARNLFKYGLQYDFPSGMAKEYSNGYIEFI